MKVKDIPKLLKNSEYYNSLIEDLLLDDDDEVSIDEQFIVSKFKYDKDEDILQALRVCSYWGMIIPDELLLSIYDHDNSEFLIDENNRNFILRIQKIKKLIQYIVYDDYMHLDSIIQISKLVTDDLMPIVINCVPEIIPVIYILQNKLEKFENIKNTVPYIECRIIDAAIVSNSIECLNMFNVKILDESQEMLLGEYGNPKFFELLEQNNIQFSNILEYSIIYEKFDNIDYLLDRGKNMHECLQLCLDNSKINSLKYLIEKYSIKLQNYSDLDYTNLNSVDIVIYLMDAIDYNWAEYYKLAIRKNSRELFDRCLPYVEEFDENYIVKNCFEYCSLDFIDYLSQFFNRINNKHILFMSLSSNDINKVMYVYDKYFEKNKKLSFEEPISNKKLTFIDGYFFIEKLSNVDIDVIEFVFSLVDRRDYSKFIYPAILYEAYNVLVYLDNEGVNINITKYAHRIENYNILEYFNLPIVREKEIIELQEEMLEELKREKRLRTIKIHIEEVSEPIILRYLLSERNIKCDRNELLKRVLSESESDNVLTVLMFSQNIDLNEDLIEKYVENVNIDIIKMLVIYGFKITDEAIQKANFDEELKDIYNYLIEKK